MREFPWETSNLIIDLASVYLHATSHNKALAQEVTNRLYALLIADIQLIRRTYNFMSASCYVCIT